MSVWGTLNRWADDAWHAIAGLPGDISAALERAWHVAVTVSQVVDWVIRNPFLALTESTAYLIALLTGNTVAMRNVARREHDYIWGNEIQPLRAQVISWFSSLEARIAYLFAMAYIYINKLYRQSLAYTRQQVSAEHSAMLRQFQVAEAYTRQQVTALDHLIQQEAASGYSATLHERVSTVQRVIDLIVARNPAVRAATSDVTRIILDLLIIDDPVARLLASVLIHQVINRLGIDKAAGQLLADLAGPLLGNPRPQNLHDVVGNIGQRLDALDAQWATFMDDGGSQVLQAGREWRDITGLVTDAGLLAFFGAAVASPERWAADVASAAGPLVREATAAVSSLLD